MHTERWSTAYLDAMREVADPVADALVAEIFAAEGRQGIRALNDFLQHFDAPLDDTVPETIRAFFEAPVVYPDWVDLEQIDQAQTMFKTWGLQVMLVVFIKSWPQFFANAHASRVFYQADLFNPGSVKRFLLELAQLIIDLMHDDSFETEPASGQGIVALQKLRLHHAVVRHYIHTSEQPWDPAWGQPINQEDLAGAMLAFALYDLDGFEKLELDLSPEQQEATLAMWKLICFFLGLDEELQPANIQEGRVLLARIEQRQYVPSEEGTALTHQLLGVMQGFLPRMLKSLPIYLMRYLMEPRFIALLQVPKPKGPTWLVLTVMEFLLGIFKVYNKITLFFSRRFVKGLTTATGRQGQRGAFRLLPEWES